MLFIGVKKMKHFFIINPTSGNGKSHKPLIESIHSVCLERKLEYEVRTTEYAGHAKWIVSTELSSNRDRIRFYACGGDGTVNEVASGLVGHPRAELAIIPVGTGNDFVRTFPVNADFLDLDAQLNGNSRRVDAVSAGDSIFVNMLNVGFDSRVVSTISRLRDKSRLMRGKFAYIISVAINFFKMPKTRLKCVFDDGERVEGEFLLSAFANGKYYGGGFKAGADAEPDDGIIDVLFVRPCSRFVFLSLISKYKKGTLLKSPRSLKYVVFKKCKSLVAEFSLDSDVCVDGEIVDEHSFNIEVLEGAVNLSLPVKEKV